MALRLRPASLLIIVVFLLFQQVRSLFTEGACWPGTARCIQRSAGTASWCFVAVARDSTTTSCVGPAVDFQTVLAEHLSQDLSIAYYDGASNRRLGGASEYNVTGAVGVIRLCASGLAGNGVLYTICTNVAADNVFNGSPACVVIGGPARVNDGCYDLARQQTRSTTTTSTPRTSATSSSTTTSSTTSTSSTEQPSTRSSTKEESQTSTSPPATVMITPTVTIVNNLPAPTSQPDKTKDVAVPIVVALLGVVSAALGVGFWKRRQKQNANQVAGRVAGMVQRGFP